MFLVYFNIPNKGAGLLQARVVYFVEFLPQVAVQADHGCQAPHCPSARYNKRVFSMIFALDISIPGQDCVAIHVSVSIDEPGHVTPPYVDVICVQERVRTVYRNKGEYRSSHIYQSYKSCSTSGRTRTLLTPCRPLSIYYQIHKNIFEYIATN